MATSAFAVEVITLPANHVDRSLRFHVDQVGFALDVDSGFAGCADPDLSARTLQERGFRHTPEEG